MQNTLHHTTHNPIYHTIEDMICIQFRTCEQQQHPTRSKESC